jgi:hypothetical protein
MYLRIFRACVIEGVRRKNGRDIQPSAFKYNHAHTSEWGSPVKITPQTGNEPA